MTPIVPHKGKMLLLSRVINYDLKEKVLNAEYDITENCIFYNHGIEGVPAFVGFEFIAQAIAAFSGIKRQLSGEEPKIGYILSVSSMQINIPCFHAGSTAKITVKETDYMDNAYNYEGEIYINDNKVLYGKLTVIEANDD